VRRTVLFLAVALLSLVGGPPAREVAAEGLGTPLPDSSGRVRWAHRGHTVTAEELAVLPIVGARDAVRGKPLEPARRDSMVSAEIGTQRYWRGLLGSSRLRPYALRGLAGLALTAGDSALADSCWAQVALLANPWQWEALRARTDLALARADTVGADRLLESAERRDWPDSERAEWLARRLELRRALRDTAEAVRFARQFVRLYPNARGGGRAVDVLTSLLPSRGDSLTDSDQRAVVEVEVVRGRWGEAARRLARMAAQAARAESWRLHLRRAELLREAERFAEAHQALLIALAAAPRDGDRARCLLERARVLRDQNRPDQAAQDYARAAGGAGTDTSLLASALWERARTLESDGQWLPASDDYGRLALLGRRRDEEAALRAGLMSVAVGNSERALEFWSRVDSEATLFWRGVLLRRSRRTAGDSLLRRVGARPGYAFYRAAARESLGVTGWPVPAVDLADDLRRDELGLAWALNRFWSDDAAFVLERWTAGDPRLARHRPALGRDWLAAAAAAYAGGRPRQAIRFAQRATAAFADSAARFGWGASIWLYPPAYDSLFAAYPESAADGRIDRALLQALAWKESAFDARARSRSDALGLLQLQRAAVIDVARWLHEPVPSDSALADPALNLRYGALYLERLLARFPGDLPLALAAYNAGPTVARRWSRLRSFGGDALACEEIDYPETQDYVKSVLAARQAYRELRPVLAR
jgi:soluble lytic murein transglycosylase-like protein